MTGCVYLSPRLKDDSLIFPAIFADTLVTIRGAQGGKSLPATAGTPLFGQPSTKLARKVHIIDQAALAYAGRADIICSLHNDYLQFSDEWLKGEHPLRPLGAQADQYRSYYRAPIEVLGAHLLERGGQRGIHNMAFNGFGEIGSLGYCQAIGSGVNDLLSRLQGVESRFAKIFAINPPEAVRGLAGHLNGERLAEEIVTKGDLPNTWGGYVEHVYYDHATQKWNRGSKHVNLFYIVRRVDAALIVGTLLPKAILYDPGDSIGRICAIALDSASSICTPYCLQAPWDDTPVDPLADAPEFWTGWRAESATITFIFEGPADYGFGSRTANPSEMKDVFLEVGDRIGIGLSDDLADKLFVELSADVGVECITAKAYVARQ